MVVRRVRELGYLSAAERKVLDELATGEVIDISEAVPEQGDERRRVRAELIRLLLGDGTITKYRLYEKGLRIRGAWIPDRLDLEGCRGLRDLALISCRFEEVPLLRSTELGNLFLSRSCLPGLSRRWTGGQGCRVSVGRRRDRGGAAAWGEAERQPRMRRCEFSSGEGC